MSRTLLVVLGIFILSGCTSRDVYHNVQINQQNQCETLPYPQRDECLKHVSTDYNDYERERKNLRKKDK